MSLQLSLWSEKNIIINFCKEMIRNYITQEVYQVLQKVQKLITIDFVNGGPKQLLKLQLRFHYLISPVHNLLAVQ